MASLSEIREQFPQYSDLSDGDLLMGMRQKFYPDMHPRTFFQSIEGGEGAFSTIKNPELRKVYRADVQKSLDGETDEQRERRLFGRADAPVGDPGGKIGSTLRSLLQGLTLGGGDEIVAAGASALGSNTYEQELQAERDRLALGREQNPGLSLASEIGGAVAMPAAALKVTGGLGLKSAKSAAAALPAGLAYGFGAGEGGAVERAKNSAITGGLSAAVGGAAPALVKVVTAPIQQVMEGRAVKKAIASAPSVEELAKRAKAIFQNADKVPLQRADFAAGADDILSRAMDDGFHPKLTKKSAIVLDEIVDAASKPDPAMKFKEITELRRMTDAPASNFLSRPDQKVGMGIRESIDEFVDNLDPALEAEIGEARKMWSILRKNDVIEEAVMRAGNQASGFENGLRVQFRSILNSPKKRARFTKAEIKAMEQVTKGTVVGNLMKKVGKLGFGRGNQTNVLSGTAGLATMGPLAPVAGQAALLGSEAITAKNALRMQALLRAGGLPNQPQISGQTIGLMEEMMRRPSRTVEAFR